VARIQLVWVISLALSTMAGGLYGAGANPGAQDRDRGYGGYGDPGAGLPVTCSSDDGRRHYCNADTRNGVQMTRQRSGSACKEGYSWGYDRRGIWVDHGCRADFVVRQNNARYNRPDRRDDNRSGYRGRGEMITCSSDDGGRHYCNADTSGGVRMVNQRSGSACQQGRSWGYDRRGIWVDHGCRADFEVGGRR
jgi:Protein of unknown function (DUF3011)